MEAMEYLEQLLGTDLNVTMRTLIAFAIVLILILVVAWVFRRLSYGAVRRPRRGRAEAVRLRGVGVQHVDRVTTEQGRDARQRGDQRRAPAHLVGLGAASRRLGHQPIGVGEQPLAERRIAADRRAEQGRDREHERRLPTLARQQRQRLHGDSG